MQSDPIRQGLQAVIWGLALRRLARAKWIQDLGRNATFNFFLKSITQRTDQSRIIPSVELKQLNVDITAQSRKEGRRSKWSFKF